MDVVYTGAVVSAMVEQLKAYFHHDMLAQDDNDCPVVPGERCHSAMPARILLDSGSGIPSTSEVLMTRVQ